MRRVFRALLLPAALLPVAMMVSADARADENGEGWIVLFNGEDLAGWEKHSGKAVYKVEDGAIVGHSVPNSPNTFLCTEQKFRDFELVFETIVDPELNSGVQIRSNLKQEGDIEDRVFGPQVEIEVGPGESGYIYGEATGRGWLSEDLSKTITLKTDDWNHYRVVAKGDNIKTWVNGEPMADLTDPEVDQTGMIGLQVHGVGPREDPLYVRWRNIKIRPLD